METCIFVQIVEIPSGCLLVFHFHPHKSMHIFSELDEFNEFSNTFLKGKPRIRTQDIRTVRTTSLPFTLKPCSHVTIFSPTPIFKNYRPDIILYWRIEYWAKWVLHPFCPTKSLTPLTQCYNNIFEYRCRAEYRHVWTRLKTKRHVPLEIKFLRFCFSLVNIASSFPRR